LKIEFHRSGRMFCSPEGICFDGPGLEFNLFEADLAAPALGCYVSAKASLQKPYSGLDIEWVETAADEVVFAVSSDNYSLLSPQMN
jgi:hypothetical protein